MHSTVDINLYNYEGIIIVIPWDIVPMGIYIMLPF